MRDVNQHVTCSLCAGYLVDATTITECLHTCKLIVVYNSPYDCSLASASLLRKHKPD